MAALKRLSPSPDSEALRIEPSSEGPRRVAHGQAGVANPALQAQLDRLAAFAAESDATQIIRVSPRVRLLIIASAGVLPWLGIWVAVRAVLGLR
jgi:hypothetical protein